MKIKRTHLIDNGIDFNAHL